MHDAFSIEPFSRPAFGSVAPWARRLHALVDWPTVTELDALLADRLRIDPTMTLEEQVPEARRRRGERADRREEIYELRIHTQRRLPTRAGSWHDLANALVWCAFPSTKRALTARQHAIVATRVAPDATRLPPCRTREQDALAMLDEGGVVLVSSEPPAIEAALRRGDRERLRAPDVRALVFGHALLEHEAKGRDVRGYAVVIEGSVAEDIDRVDRALANLVSMPTTLREPEPWRGVWLRALFA